jgi:hypothetical protein
MFENTPKVPLRNMVHDIADSTTLLGSSPSCLFVLLITMQKDEDDCVWSVSRVILTGKIQSSQGKFRSEY